jgi:hypothetical protein
MSKIVKKFGQFTQASQTLFLTILVDRRKTRKYAKNRSIIIQLTPETSEEFKRLQDDTKSRKECIDDIMSPLEAYFKISSNLFLTQQKVWMGLMERERLWF